jgi:hypothetical protein
LRVVLPFPSLRNQRRTHTHRGTHTHTTRRHDGTRHATARTTLLRSRRRRASPADAAAAAGRCVRDAVHAVTALGWRFAGKPPRAQTGSGASAHGQHTHASLAHRLALSPPLGRRPPLLARPCPWWSRRLHASTDRSQTSTDRLARINQHAADAHSRASRFPSQLSGVCWGAVSAAGLGSLARLAASFLVVCCCWH